MNRRIHFTSQMCAMEPILQMRKPRCREIPSHSVCGGGSRVKMQPRTGPAPKLMFFPKMLLLTLRDAGGNKPAHRGYPTQSSTPSLKASFTASRCSPWKSPWASRPATVRRKGHSQEYRIHDGLAPNGNRPVMGN